MGDEIRVVEVHVEDEVRVVGVHGLLHRQQAVNGGVDERGAVERGYGSVEGGHGEGMHHHLEDDRRGALLPGLHALVVETDAAVDREWSRCLNGKDESNESGHHPS